MLFCYLNLTTVSPYFLGKYGVVKAKIHGSHSELAAIIQYLLRLLDMLW